jgi:dipeptidyl aminopeptidase/acylaminoacyl peptidase/tRNA A-37 threonylcarbamoyl transferase component Bud32
MSDLPQSLVDALADRYRIERDIGQGGMATVYLAHDLRHDRKVAIKLLRPELAAVIGAERFLAEIRTTANLQHPHILPLHDSGTAGSSVFYVMPFVEGESLRGRLERDKQLSIPESIRIVTQVAQALDYAHRHGVIHRDIKPENILLHDGSALVADFGIALAATSAGTRMTETGMSLGTPSYMSPEQAMGERALDARTDVYALGCVLYELLVGEPPFVGPTAQAIVTKVVTERPTPPSRARDTVNEALDDVVLRALSKVPADRFATAAEFAAALAASQEMGNARTTTRAAHVPAVQAGRRFGAGVLLGAVVIGSLWMGSRLVGGDTVREEQRVQLTFDGLAEQPTLSHDGKFVAYVRRPCDMTDVPECASSLLLREEGNDRTVTLVDSARTILNVRWSPDGTRLLFVAELDSARGGIYSIPRLGGSMKLVTSRFAPFDVHGTADSIALLDGRVVHVLDIDSGAEGDSAVLEGSTFPEGVSWSPDGRHFATTADFIAMHVYARSGAVVDSVRSTFRPKSVWTRDGRALIAFIAREGKEDDLTRYPVGRDGKFSAAPQVLMSKVPAVLRGDFSLARETGRIAVRMGSAIIDLWIFELGNESSARRLTSGTAWYSVPTITPDGSRLWYMRGDGLGDNLYSVGLDEREEARSAQRFPSTLFPVVSLDGRRVLYGNMTSTSARLSEQLLPSGEERHGDGWPDASASIVPVGLRAVAYVSTRRDAIYVADSITGTLRRVAVAPNLAVLAIAAGPSDAEVMAIAWEENAETRESAQVIGTLRLADGVFTPRVRPPRLVTGLTWRADGSVWYSQRQAGESRTWLWELRPGATQGERRMRLPEICDRGAAAVAARAPRGTCASVDMRADVWTVDLPSMMR